MNYRKEKEEGCVRIYDVSFSSNDYTSIENEALKEVQKAAIYPGFRKGKVPFEILKEHFHEAVNEEIRHISLHKAVEDIMDKENLIPVVTPSAYDIKHDPNSKKISFKLYFELVPSFEPKGYTDFEVVKRIKKITDKDVENHIEQIRQYNSYLKPTEEPVSNDKFILVDYEIYEDGKKIDEVKNELIDMSSPQSIIGFEEAVTGARKGERREFETEFEGKKLKFVVDIKEVKIKVIPEMDETMIKQLGAENLDDLKKQIKEILENDEKIKAERNLVEQIENKLIENNTFALPPTLVKQEIEELFEIAKKRANIPKDHELDISKYEDKLKPIAERNLKIAYILHAISKKENIRATEEDFLKELDKVISNLKSEDEIIKAKELFNSRKSYIMATITENKTMEFIKSKIKIREEIVE